MSLLPISSASSSTSSTSANSSCSGLQETSQLRSKRKDSGSALIAQEEDSTRKKILPIQNRELSALLKTPFYQDLGALYPRMNMQPCDCKRTNEEIRAILEQFIKVEFPHDQHLSGLEGVTKEFTSKAMQYYTLSYNCGAPALYYAATQILDRMANAQREIHAIFSGRDATGMYLTARALTARALQKIPIRKNQLHIVYLSREIVNETDEETLRKYIEETTHTQIEQSSYFFIDVGWLGTRLEKMQRVLNGRIEQYLLLFSRAEEKKGAIGLIDDLDRPLPALRSPIEKRDIARSSSQPFGTEEAIRLGITGSPAVNFIEDMYSGPFREMQLLVKKEGQLTPSGLNRRFESFFDSVPRFFALLGAIDYVVEKKQKGQLAPDDREQVRNLMNEMLEEQMKIRY